jgi:glycyl-tRNA synthetase beta chain
MVREFTELQGTMGGIYARAEGLPEEVWKAIYFHYLPLGVEADAPPTKAQLGKAAVTWAAVSLADKLDTIVGLFAAGEKPTGSRDPYGLRRAGHGIVKVLVDLESLTGVRRRPALGVILAAAREGLRVSDPTQDEKNQLWIFLIDRLRHLMQTRGLQYEEIQAVTGRVADIERVNAADLVERAREIGRVRETAVFASVAEAFKRANNIVEDAWGNVGADVWRRNADRLSEPAELNLRSALDRLGSEIRQALDGRQPGKALAAIASVQPELAKFFTEVRVMVPDQALQDARLALLAELRDRISEVGDISVLAPKQA